MFITFEGGDGAGKTTQIELLKAALEKEGRSVVVTREPGGNAVAEKIRELLLDRRQRHGGYDGSVSLCCGARRACSRGDPAALARGQVVLCDRFIDSSVAYQGYGRQIGAERVEALNREAVDGCLPERTYLLTLSEQDAAQRVKNRGEVDRIESAGEAFARRVQEGFLRIAAEHPERVVVIDAGRPAEEIARDIAEDVAKLKT